MSNISRLAADLYREEVTRARAMRPEDRLLEGPRLFERARRVMADGVRHRHPGMSEPDVAAAVQALFDRLRQLDRS